MFVVIFHMIYLFGKYVYDNYRDRKASKSSNNGTGEETATGRYAPDDYEDDIEDEYTELLPLERFSNPIKFSPPAYIQRYLAVGSVLKDPKYANKLRKVTLSFVVLLQI